MKPTNLFEACDAFVAHLADTGVNPNSLASYAWNLRLLMNHFGPDKDLNKLLAPHIANFYRSDAVTTKVTKDGGKVPRSAGSIAQIRRVVRWAVAWWHDQGWIERLPLPNEDRQAAEEGQSGPGHRRRKMDGAGTGAAKRGLTVSPADSFTPLTEPEDGLIGNAVAHSDPADSSVAPLCEPQTGTVAMTEPGEGIGQGEGFHESQNENAGPGWTLL